jgi:outer membrane protein OmpA-like peptidoglycan-associated protein
MKSIPGFSWKLSGAAASAVVLALSLAGCAGQPQTTTMAQPSGTPQAVTMGKGTMTGAASTTEADTLAKMVATSNNNAMTEFDRMGSQMSTLQAAQGQELTAQQKELKTSQEALAKLEQLSTEQGSGSITLFFAEGSAKLDQFQYQRLVGFLDYLSRESRGRSVILVSIGSASAVGPASVNRKLSVERSEAPISVVNQYLVNIPHRFYKVSALGDMYAPKNAPQQIDARYQSVRIVAAYDAAQLPGS